MGFNSAFVAGQAQFHDIGCGQQAGIGAGVGLMTVAAVLEGYGVLIFALEFLIIVARQTQRDAFFEQKLRAISNVRPVTFNAAILPLQRSVNDRIGRALQEIFVTGKTDSIDRRHKLMRLHAIVTRRAVAIGKRNVLIRQQQPFGTRRSGVGGVTVLAIDTLETEPLVSRAQIAIRKVVTLSAQIHLRCCQQGGLITGVRQVAGATVAIGNRRMRGALGDLTIYVLVTGDTETLRRFGCQARIGRGVRTVTFQTLAFLERTVVNRQLLLLLDIFVTGYTETASLKPQQAGVIGGVQAVTGATLFSRERSVLMLKFSGLGY